MTHVRILLLWLAALCAFALPAQAQTFPKLTGRVVDAADLLSPEQEAQLTALSEQVEQASGRQFVVATIPDLQGYPIEDYGYRLGREWQIGQKDANNGIILIVAPNERKVRIEVGYGLEPVVPDGLASDIINETILPKFRDGDMPGGIMAGAQEIGEQMKLPLEQAEIAAKQRIDASAGKRASNDDDGIGVFIALFWIIVVGVVVISAIAGRAGRGRRYRRGSGLGNVLLWTAIDAALRSGSDHHSGGSSWGGGSWGGGGGGGFSGGGGSFGGGGASGSW
ncbi:MAG: TPM domain-containing protein [Pseudomonadota bacterium]